MVLAPAGVLALVLVLVLPLAGAGCKTADPLFCDTDQQCQDPQSERFNASTPYCNTLDHSCFDGCQRDADCQNAAPNNPRFEGPGKPHCNLQTHHCEGGGGGDGGGDGMADAGGDGAGSELELGAGCSAVGQCKSGHCVDGVCCDSACGETCRTCNQATREGTCSLVADGQDPRSDCAGKGVGGACAGSCDGTGGCQFPQQDVTCGSASCSAGALSEKRCDGEGRCTAQAGTCGGYVCTAGGDACETSCGNGVQCAAGYLCNGGKCENNLPNGTACGSNDAACASKQCVDGVCCADAACGTCHACDVSGKQGSCQPVPAGPAPAGHCPGVAACGGNKCDGSGACAYEPTSTECNASCKPTGGSYQRELFSCDGQGNCNTAATTSESCGPYQCKGTGLTAACLTGCASHPDCIAASLCDRSTAHSHPTGHGICIPEAQIQPVTTTIQSTIDTLPQGKTHIKIPPGTYGENIGITNKTINIVGVGAVTLKPPVSGGDNKPIVDIQGAASVTLQGVTLKSAPASGIRCIAANPTGVALGLIESSVISNESAGVNSFQCDVTLRRNIIKGNQGGGVSLANGTFVLVNNVIVENGTKDPGGSTTGGVGISNSTSAVIANNAIVNNRARSTSAAGIACMGSEKVFNGIIWGNESGPQHLGCTFEHSTVQGASAPAGTGNQNVDCNVDATFRPQAAACIDAGLDSAAGLGSIDLANGARKKGTAVDLGAYEVN